MNFLKLSKSQLSRGEMRNVTGGKVAPVESCNSYCENGAVCDMLAGCRCVTLHGHDRCYKD